MHDPECKHEVLPTAAVPMHESGNTCPCNQQYMGLPRLTVGYANQHQLWAMQTMALPFIMLLVHESPQHVVHASCQRAAWVLGCHAGQTAWVHVVRCAGHGAAGVDSHAQVLTRTDMHATHQHMPAIMLPALFQICCGRSACLQQHSSQHAPMVQVQHASMHTYVVTCSHPSICASTAYGHTVTHA